jgi:hypothetical protein
MRRLAFAVTVAAVVSIAASSRASLTPSEAEQVRRGVATATDLGRVRALVARPDLSSDEAAAALIAPLRTTIVDPPHAIFLHDLVFGDSSVASRPVLAVATLRGALARADAVIAQYAPDLERSAAGLAELTRLYAWVEQLAAVGSTANVPDSARELCAAALADHLARNGAVLAPQSAVGAQVARVRAQAAIAMLDLMPDAATRRIDAADRLALTGARRALLIERGVLALDASGSDARAAALRGLFDRLPALHDGLEAIVVGAEGATYSARDGAVLTTADDPGGNAGALLLWGADVRAPPGDGWTTAVARGLATRAVTRALAQRERLAAQIERDGGGPGVAAMVAMLISNGPLAVEVAAARLIGGHGESAACLADAIGALAVFASPPGAHDAAPPAIPVGPARTAAAAAPASAQLTHVAFGPSGAATSFRLEGRTWTFRRDAEGAVTALLRDGVPVTKAMLVAARP